MFHRCVLLLAVAAITVSSGAALAASVFVDINSFNNQSNRDLRAYPTGVSPLLVGGGVVLQGAQNLTANPVPYYDSCYYSGGANGVMSNLNSTLVYGSVTFNRSDGDAMNENGDFTNSVIQNTPQVQWLTTNHGTNTTYYDNVPTGSGNAIRGIGIDANDDICGTYYGRPTTYGTYPYISINGGRSVPFHVPSVVADHGLVVSPRKPQSRPRSRREPADRRDRRTARLRCSHSHDGRPLVARAGSKPNALSHDPGPAITALRDRLRSPRLRDGQRPLPSSRRRHRWYACASRKHDARNS